MKIGNILINDPVALGPMAGVTDLAFRLICKEFGCGIVFTEMVSAKGIYYEDKKTELLMRIEDREKPVALQIFGSDPKIMGIAAKKIEDRDHDILDINIGCPAPKIVKNGDGSALMKDPKLLGEIVKSVSASTYKPVTVKIRAGWDSDNINAVEIAKIAEANGAKAISVHGRTREQFYTGKADWDIIRDVKNAVDVPVFGNGDVTSVEDAVRMKEHTDCDGIMIARGAQGNPWIFKRVSHYMKTGNILEEPTIFEKVDVIKKHLAMMIAIKGEHVAIREMRKHCGWYLKGLNNGAKIRHLINQTTSVEEIMALLNELVICNS